MHKIKEPSFPERTVSICDYGAISGGTTKNTKAFTEAINACAKAGGGKVLVPSGLWLTGAIVLKSNINLHLAEGAEICFSTDPNDYLPIVFTRWAGIECYNYSPLIYANNCTNLAITGTGSLIGQGRSWWHWTEIQGDAVRRLLDAGLNNVPIKKRIFGTVKDALRPQFIQLVDCSDVLLEDFTVEDGPFWTIDLLYCENAVVRNIKVNTHGPNGDGIDVNSSRNVLIEYCNMATEDDAVAIKSGMNEDGRRVARPSENIVVRYCNLKAGNWGGISIGSDMSGDVRNVFIHDIKFDGTLLGFYIKSRRGRGGVVENIWVQDITMRRIKLVPIFLDMFYNAFGVSRSEVPPTVRNINIKNLTCESTADAVKIIGLPEKNIENITLENISIVSQRGLSCSDVNGVNFINVQIRPAKGPIMKLKDSCNVTINKSVYPESTTAVVEIEGSKTKSIKLFSNDLSKVKEKIIIAPDVPSDQITMKSE